MAKKSSDQLSAEHELLLAYIEGELDHDQEAAFEATMTGREDLAELTRRLRDDRQRTARLPEVQPPQDLAELAIDRLERNLLLDGTPSARSPRKPRSHLGRYAAYATAALVCIACGAVLWQSLTTGQSLMQGFPVARSTPPQPTPEAQPSTKAPAVGDTVAAAPTQPEAQPEPQANYGTTQRSRGLPATQTDTQPPDTTTLGRGVPTQPPAADTPRDLLVINTANPQVMVNVIEQWARNRALPVRNLGQPARVMTLENLLSGKGIEDDDNAPRTITLEIEGPPFAIQTLRGDLTTQPDADNPQPPTDTPATDAQDNSPLATLLRTINMPASLSELVPPPDRIPLSELNTRTEKLRIRIVADTPEPPSTPPAVEMHTNLDPAIPSDDNRDTPVAPRLEQPDAGQSDSPGIDAD
ncbi:hypothetical protein Pan265_04960 [Mucisphaera calidilacus]|uniref:Uncharacterized protein n=1 Tax=Mucisphaera calidilacus TaxID=2527982 RepID=A0A518BUM0_9BACT|nr:hypothetical protein Pan265_04960 [Mucisphaera calidilacus]